MTGRPPATDRHTTRARWAAVVIGAAAAAAGASAVTSTWPVLAVASLVGLVCAPLAALGVWAGLLLLGGRRIRLRYVAWPRPALVATDAPRPSCPYCRGAGGWDEPYADYDGEYGGETTVTCDCWTDWTRTLLPVPAWAARLLDRAHHRAAWRSVGYPGKPPSHSAGYSDEPPF